MPDTVPPAGDPDSAKVIAVVASIPLAVDLGRFDLAEAAFAPEIVIDYSSLWGGEFTAHDARRADGRLARPRAGIRRNPA